MKNGRAGIRTAAGLRAAWCVAWRGPSQVASLVSSPTWMRSRRPGGGLQPVTVKREHEFGAGRSTSAESSVSDELRGVRRWALSRHAVLFIKGVSAATFASTAVAVCADKSDSARGAEGAADSGVVSLSRVLGEPTSIEAPHARYLARLHHLLRSVHMSKGVIMIRERVHFISHAKYSKCF